MFLYCLCSCLYVSRWCPVCGVHAHVCVCMGQLLLYYISIFITLFSLYILLPSLPFCLLFNGFASSESLCLLILIYLILAVEIYRLNEDGILKMQKHWFCYKHKIPIWLCEHLVCIKVSERSCHLCYQI